MKGRKVFGEMLPFGEVWRTGANASTKIVFENNAKVAGQEVPAGTYALYTIPNEKTFTVIIHKNLERWGAGGYDPAEDLFRVEIPVKVLANPVETFTIDFENFRSDGADLTITWENTKLTVPIFADSDKMVFADIDKKILNAEDKSKITGRTYFDAATFYMEKNKDLKLASEWMDKAVAMNPTAFWQIYAQGELALQLGDVAKAKSCAEASMKIAKANKDGDYGYVAKCASFLKKLASK